MSAGSLDKTAHGKNRFCLVNCVLPGRNTWWTVTNGGNPQGSDSHIGHVLAGGLKVMPMGLLLEGLAPREVSVLSQGRIHSYRCKFISLYLHCHLWVERAEASPWIALRTFSRVSPTEEKHPMSPPWHASIPVRHPTECQVWIIMWPEHLV